MAFSFLLKTFLVAACIAVQATALQSHLIRTSTTLTPFTFTESSTQIQNKESEFSNKRRHIQFSRHTRNCITTLRAGSLSIPGCGPLNNFFIAYPYAAAFIICAFKASAADCVAQVNTRSSQVYQSELKTRGGEVAIRRKTFLPNFKFNLKRNLAFLAYGGLYQGICQEFIYNNLFTSLFGASTKITTAGMKVLFDMFAIQPLVALPIAYLIKAVVFKYSFAEAIGKYLIDIKQNSLLQKCWMIWGPAMFISFSFVPKHFRISFMASVSFFWLILFSSLQSKTVTD